MTPMLEVWCKIRKFVNQELKEICLGHIYTTDRSIYNMVCRLLTMCRSAGGSGKNNRLKRWSSKILFLAWEVSFCCLQWVKTAIE